MEQRDGETTRKCAGDICVEGEVCKGKSEKQRNPHKADQEDERQKKMKR